MIEEEEFGSSCARGGDKQEKRKWYLNKVIICGVDTSTLPTLKQSEMRRLLEQTKKGDKAARNKLVTGNLRLVLSVIQRFPNRSDQADDLFQVGCIGLMKAIDNFDISQNVRFSTYAVPMIIGEIRRFCGIIRLFGYPVPYGIWRARPCR